MRIGLVLTTLVGVSAAACASGVSTEQVGVRFPVIYADMDGTLLATVDGRREIPKETVDALRCYQNAGGRWSIATGRTFDQVRQKIAGLHPDLPLVLFNGAVRMDPTTHVLLKPEPPRLASGVVDAVETIARDWRDDMCSPSPSCIMGLVIHGATHTVGKPFFSSAVEEGDGKEGSKLWETFLLQGDLRTPDAELPTDDPSIKVMVVTRDERHGATDELRNRLKAKIAERLGALGYKDFAIVTSNETVEVMPPGIDKAVAIERTIREENILWRDVLVFGDSGNDIGMIDRGIGVIVLHKEKVESCHPGACAVAVALVSEPAALARFIREVAVQGECPVP